MSGRCWKRWPRSWLPWADRASRPASLSRSSALLSPSGSVRGAGQGGSSESVDGRHPGAGARIGDLGSVPGEALRRPRRRCHQGRAAQRRSGPPSWPVGRSCDVAAGCRQLGAVAALPAPEHQQAQRDRGCGQRCAQRRRHRVRPVARCRVRHRDRGIRSRSSRRRRAGIRGTAQPAAGRGAHVDHTVRPDRSLCRSRLSRQRHRDVRHGRPDVGHRHRRARTDQAQRRRHLLPGRQPGGGSDAGRIPNEPAQRPLVPHRRVGVRSAGGHDRPPHVLPAVPGVHRRRRGPRAPAAAARVTDRLLSGDRRLGAGVHAAGLGSPDGADAGCGRSRAGIRRRAVAGRPLRKSRLDARREPPRGGGVGAVPVAAEPYAGRHRSVRAGQQVGGDAAECAAGRARRPALRGP